MKRRGFRSAVVLGICLLLILSLVPARVSARERMDENRAGSLTLTYPVEGIEFRLYRVADISGFGELQLTEEMSAYPITLAAADQEGWKELALTFYSYLVRDGHQPLEIKKTNAQGRLTFDTTKLGMYLVAWDSHVTGGRRYEAQPFFVSLPTLQEQNDAWVYDVTAKVKTSISEKVYTDLHVHKAWEDQKDAAKKRPSYIRVQLLCDGEVKDTVQLNEANSWSYDWKDLEAEHSWTVTEETVPQGYTVKVTQEGTAFLLTNTYSTPGGGTPPGTPPGTPSGRLPQTGMLWWPVPVLACLGLLLFAIGWLLRKR